MSSALLLPVDEFGLIRRPAALAAGWTDAMLSAATRAGRLIRLGLGVYVERTSEFDGPEGTAALYRLQCIATVTGTRDHGATVLSHQSAASLHGIDLLKPDQSQVHVTALSGAGAGIRGGRRIHSTRIRDDEITTVDGLRVTSLVRTAVDVAETVGFAQALTVFDGALAQGADSEEIAAALGRRRTKGARLARGVLPHASKWSESVGESWSRAQMIQGGMPVPELQREYRIDGEDYRADFLWDGRLLGEFDGMGKYERLRRPGETIADTVRREKIREDRLRRHTGLMLVRWTWADLERHRLVDLLREYLPAAG